MFFATLLLLAVCIGMPLYCTWRVWHLRTASRSAWLIVVAEGAMIVALVFILGRWDMAGYYMRFLLLALFAAACVASLWKHRDRLRRAPGASGAPLRHRSRVLSLGVLASMLAYLVYGILPPEEARELAFPLQGGRFMVGQGGGVRLLNHHADHAEQRYAADIVAINASGFRASGILPRQPEAYAIFGAAVTSPCAGEVLGVRDALPDLDPPQRDQDNPRGNHIIIACDGVRVELAHLRNGSIEVRPGQSVRAGDRLASVGNSGNTTEPHLHVHAVDARTGLGVPVAFAGRVPVRNALYVN